ncbi:MAG: type II secretion system protein [Thermodesulfobacteriota bacterium]
MKTGRRHQGKTQSGATLIEVITALVLVGVLAAILSARDPRAGTNLQIQRDTLEKHLRDAQMLSMQSGGIQAYQGGTAGQVYGIRCDGTNYWMFSGTNPDAAGAVVPLMDDSSVTTVDGKLSLAAKEIFMGPFTIYFTGWGIPCTAYVNESSNTQLAAPQTISLSAEGQARSVTITPYTGFIQ